ncbi:MAG: hypothetical protein JOY80_06435, partial [Candidatus Dormibacteraeota bacterium]|nr:hypothetical protein [Candidatus Dormibacteraeota bacterium]
MRWSTRRPQLPEPQGHRRRTLQPRRRKHRRRFWLIVAGVILTGLAALGVDLALRYLPAIRALDDGRTAAAQAQSLMQRGVDKLGDSDLSQLQSLLIRAQGDFGGKSRVIETSWLLDIAGRLPFAGDQVNALRGLRDTGSASAQLGLDALPMLRDVRGGDSGGSALGRLTAFSENNGGAIDRLSHDLDAVDAAVAQIPTNAQLLGPLGSGRALMQSLVPRLDSIRPALGVLKLLPFAAGSGQHRYLLLLDNP